MMRHELDDDRRFVIGEMTIGELDALMRWHRMQVEYVGGGFRASAYDADYEITNSGCGPTLLDAVLTLVGIECAS